MLTIECSIHQPGKHYHHLYSTALQYLLLFPQQSRHFIFRDYTPNQSSESFLRLCVHRLRLENIRQFFNGDTCIGNLCKDSLFRWQRNCSRCRTGLLTTRARIPSSRT